MRTPRTARFVFGLFLLALANGCATKALWQNTELEAWNEPATDPNLRLFAAKYSSDILVVYDEYSERSDRTQIRAYWLKENQKFIDQHTWPNFVSTNAPFGFTALPIFLASTNEFNFPPTYAIVATNGQSFTLHRDNGAIEPHDLPVYNDRKGKVEKFALTPLATAADITIIGGVLGYLYLQGLAGGGNYNPAY